MRLTGILASCLFVTLALSPFAAVIGAQSAGKKANIPSSSVLEVERLIRLAVRKAERRELVRPAPRGFKPEPTARKLKLTLVARDKTIRVSDNFWYRLEIQNVGREPVGFLEEPSFLKNGWNYDDGKWDFYALRPDGEKEQMVPGRLIDEMTRRERPNPPIDVPGGEKMSDLELKEWVWRDGLRRRAERDLEVVLAPGETLVSRPWRWVEPQEQHELLAKGEKNLWPKPSGEFRELRTASYMRPPGRHKIWVTYDDPPRSSDEDEIKELEKLGISREKTLEHYREINAKKLGRLESNGVIVEVVP